MVRSPAPPTRTRSRFRWLTGPAVCAMAACSMPTFEGPQIQSPPPGFLLVMDSYGQRPMFADHEVQFHAAWVESLRDFSTIYINGHPGVLTFDDVVAAQERAMSFAEDPDLTFGPVEAVTIDSRGGWGWSERVESPNRGLVSVAYRAMVPYDTVSYAIEFVSGEPALKRAAPDTLKAIVSSFAIGETTWNVPLIALVVGLALFGVHLLRQRRAAQAARMHSINLVKVKKEEDDEAGEVEAEPVGAQPVGRESGSAQ